MTKRLGTLVTAAAAAMTAFAILARCRRDGSNYNPGFSQFTPCPAPSPEAVEGPFQRMEMIETQAARYAPTEAKVHPPERLNRPIWALGSNCYIGSRHTDHFHEQIQLRDPHV